MSNFYPREDEEIIKICSDPDMVSYCALMLRPGFWAWMVEIEYTKFKPDTDANDDFHLSCSKFAPHVKVRGEKDQGVSKYELMMIVTFHRSEQQFAESILWKNGLRKTKPGYIPMVIDSEGAHPFFLQGPNVFYLENHSDGGRNVLYTNDLNKMKAAWEHEKEQAQKFFDAHEAWINSPEGKEISDAYWKKHPGGKVF